MSDSEQVDVAGTEGGPGDAPRADGGDFGALRTRREAAGMTIEEAASALRLAPRQVHALETGDWEALPGVAFVRGALRSYGRLLGHDVAELLVQLERPDDIQLRPAPSLGVTLPRNTVIGFGDGDFGHRWVWVALLIVGLVAVAMYFAGGQGLSGVSSWISTQTASETPAAGAPGTVTEPVAIAGNALDGAPAAPQGAASVADASAPMTTVAPAATGAPPLAVPDPAPVVGAESAANPATAAVPAPAATTSATAGAVPTLRLVFGRDSWVDIRDASGAQLLNGVQPADSVRALEGKPPFTLVIGNAAHVRLERSGRSITLEPAPSSGVARLTVE